MFAPLASTLREGNVNLASPVGCRGGSGRPPGAQSRPFLRWGDIGYPSRALYAAVKGTPPWPLSCDGLSGCGILGYAGVRADPTGTRDVAQ